MAQPAQSAGNQATWSTASAQRALDEVGGFTDAGERAALDLVREDVRNKPILDLGVGTGRTIAMLMPLTSDYRALDYSPAMVEVSRRRYPGARIDTADARDLSGYPAGHFGLVNFSFSGIDAVSAPDRRLVLRAVRRVLAPRGIFLFSTLNLDGPSYRERPWKLRLWPTRNPLKIASQMARQLAGAPLDALHWLRARRAGEWGPGYAVAPLSAHHYGILAHFTTLDRQLRELAEEGFERDVPVFENRRGGRVSLGDDTSRVDWFHLVTRRSRVDGSRLVRHGNR
jgi:SAM-dependent methyltransferase